MVDVQNEELRRWADRCEGWAQGGAGSAERTSRLVVSVASDETEELCGVLRRLQARLEEGNVEHRIAKMPDTTRLLSRLLKLDSVLCSEAAEPLFGCMACLIPSLAAPPQGEATSTTGRKVLAMRERCGEWCRERLHAAAQGMGDDAGFGASACGSSLSVDLLYDCGLSHHDMLASVTAEASREVDLMLSQSRGACSGGEELVAVGSLIVEAAHASCGVGEEQSAARVSGRACVDSSRRRWQPQDKRSSCVANVLQRHALLDDMAAIDEQAVLVRVEALLGGLASQMLLPEGEVHSLVRSACAGVRHAPWVILALEEGLEGALLCLEYFHPNLALALSLLPQRHCGAGGGGDGGLAVQDGGCSPMGCHRADEGWLWNTWAQGSEDPPVGYGPVLEPGSRRGDAAEDAWPRACSVWYCHGPDALIDAFSSSGQQGRDRVYRHLWTAVKVLSVRCEARGAGMSTALRLHRAWCAEAGAGDAAAAGCAEVAGVVSAAKIGWTQARGVTLVTVSAILGADGCTRAQRSGLVGLLEAERWGMIPPSVALTVLHVLRVGIRRGAREHKAGAGPRETDRLEALWRVYASVLSCGVSGEPPGDTSCSLDRKAHAMQAAELLKDCADVHAQAIAFAQSLDVHGPAS